VSGILKREEAQAKQTDESLQAAFSDLNALMVSLQVGISVWKRGEEVACLDPVLEKEAVFNDLDSCHGETANWCRYGQKKR
jgi:hypothetical protein